MALQGQTIFAASGDAGAFDECSNFALPPFCSNPDNYTPCCSSPYNTTLSVQDPASDQYVTGVGISVLTVNSNESYNSEAASLYGGGGISNYVSIPSWQATAAANASSSAMVSTIWRNVPDVVLTADPSTPYLIYDSYSCTPPQCWYESFGSSAASPLWAAFMARVNQGRVAAGNSVVGWLNPVIYQLAQGIDYTEDFHDITSGTNSYYPAETGFDDATGLGSFNGANLYNDLIGLQAPTGLTALPGNAEAFLNWSASSGAVSYNVKRSTTSGGPYTTVSTSGAVTTPNYTDSSSLTNGTTYYYVVNAVNAGGESPNSAQVSVIPGLPLPPTAGSATRGDSQATVTFEGAADNGSPITSYTATSSPGGRTGSCVVGTTCTVLGAYTSTTVSGLTNGTTYTFSVTATNQIGTGPASSAFGPVIPAGLPFPPTTVTAVPGNALAIVSFSGAFDNGSPITGYTATSSPDGKTGTGTSSPITVTGLTNGSQYSFTVTATNNVGTGMPSIYSNSVTPTPVPAPSGLSATKLGARVGRNIIYGGVVLTWTQSTYPHIVYNKIYRSTGSGPYSFFDGIYASTSYTDKTTIKGTVYNYEVLATAANYADSPFSNQVTVNY